MYRLQTFALPFGPHVKHHFAHLFPRRVSRLASIAIGLTLLWYGSSQPSLMGLGLMLFGLVAVVSAAASPRPCLQPARSPAYSDIDMPHVQSVL